MNSFNISNQLTRPSRRIILVLMIALLISSGLSFALAPTLNAQAGFTPTPIPPTPTNTPLPTDTPTPVPQGANVEPEPLLPQTGGVSWFPVVFLFMIFLTIFSFGILGFSLLREYKSRKM